MPDDLKPRALTLLGTFTTLSAAQVARALTCHRRSVVNILGQLHRAGLVERRTKHAKHAAAWKLSE